MDSTRSPHAHTLATSDMYEAGYYICLGFTVQKAEVIKESKKAIGRFTFSGDGIQKAQLVYFNGEATVNLMDFRRTYLHLNTLVGKAKKETKKAESPESN